MDESGAELHYIDLRVKPVDNCIAWIRNSPTVPLLALVSRYFLDDTKILLQIFESVIENATGIDMDL